MSTILLTKKDKDILFELSLNARATLTELAKKVKLSKQVVSYRLQQLEKKGVIEGYYAITNIYLLGRAHYRIYLKYQNMSAEKESELMSYLTNHPKIVWVVHYEGNFDAGFLTWSQNIIEFKKVLDDVNKKFGHLFFERNFSVSAEIEYLKYKFLDERQNTDSLIFGGKQDNITLGSLDKNIIKDLNVNGRIPLIELAKKHNTSAKVIKIHLDKLIKEKIILGFNIKLNNKLLGLTHRKIFLKFSKFDENRINSLSTYLRQQSIVIYLVKPVGNYDFEFEIMTKTNEQYHQLIRLLREKFSDLIENYATVTHYRELKSGQLAEL